MHAYSLTRNTDEIEYMHGNGVAELREAVQLINKPEAWIERFNSNECGRYSSGIDSFRTNPNNFVPEYIQANSINRLQYDKWEFSLWICWIIANLTGFCQCFAWNFSAKIQTILDFVCSNHLMTFLNYIQIFFFVDRSHSSAIAKI